jgi:predicted enzyme related to lactoylglutathione lyase
MPITGAMSHLVVDCADPDRLAEFWTGLLGVGVQSRWNQYVILEPHQEGAPGLVFQRVPEPKTAKNRMHLDFTIEDLAAATDLIIGSGGSQVDQHEQGGVIARIMADPEGNEFCLVDLSGVAGSD